MESPTPGQTANVTISEAQALKFLERLATDDDFRDELARDPGGVLGDHGIELDPESVPDTVTLPPKAEIGEFVERQKKKKAGPHNVLGFAILYWVLGAMPLVVAEDDGTG
jgi:putative modified peptide